MKSMTALLLLCFVVANPVLAEVPASDGCTDDLCPQINPSGLDQSAHTAGFIDKPNPFFEQLGSNGRTCNTCHLVDQGWSIATPDIRKLFRDTDAQAPLFRPIDAANSPNADISTPEARQQAYSQILSRGVIRIGRPVPTTPTTEFELAAVDDPTGFSTATSLSLFRRPLPIGNLRFLSTINWDGRSNPAVNVNDIRLGLMNQSNGATRNHAQAPADILPETRAQIADWELGLHHAQIKHEDAGFLNREGAQGGVENLMTQPFTLGATSNPVFTLFDSWASSTDSARRAVADGQRVFNTKTFGTSGTLTCASCHNTPNIGASATIRFFDVGISNPARRKADQILFTFRNKTTGELISTLDPGRGLINGVWADINKFKVPSLRGLAARPPYFHDGSAETIKDVVEHYQKHFNINFQQGEKQHLIKFLESL
jgi:cytochrome c peroxidase